MTIAHAILIAEMIELVILLTMFFFVLKVMWAMNGTLARLAKTLDKLNGVATLNVQIDKLNGAAVSELQFERLNGKLDGLIKKLAARGNGHDHLET
jgi:hypothetical protein